jgi:hypothetical protein
MKLQIKDSYPEPDVRCSEITLSVRITFGQPFIAPGEWDHDWMLRQLVNDEPLERVGIEDYDVNCTSHIEWVELKPITYQINGNSFTTTPQQEYAYRNHCRENWCTPTQGSFWLYVLDKMHAIRMG